MSETIPRSCGSNLQELVNEIHDQTIQNKMKLNVSKYKQLIFDFSKKNPPKTGLFIIKHGCRISGKVQSTQIFGLIFQEFLRWDKHINVVKKAGKEVLCAVIS